MGNWQWQWTRESQTGQPTTNKSKVNKVQTQPSICVKIRLLLLLLCVEVDVRRARWRGTIGKMTRCFLLIFRWTISLVEMEVHSVLVLNHTWYLSREPRVYSCKFFLAGVNFYRFNAKNWHFRQILREKVAFFFTDLTRKIGVFRCKFYSPKILPV